MKSDSRLKLATEFRLYKRNLPHFEHPGSFYFITFRTANDFILSDAAKDITLASIKFHADKKYRLHSCVVMETHVHLIVQPIEESDGVFYSIAQIMHSIKSYSANRIQRTLNRKGVVWLNENYDRIIRDDDDYIEKMNYIINNPLKSGNIEKPEDYKWLFVRQD